MKKSFLLALLGSCFVLSSNATVVSGGNVILAPDTTFGANYSITVLQTIGGDYTSMWFSKVDNKIKNTSTLTSIIWNIDEEADYYLAPMGAELSKSTISAGIFKPLFSTDKSASITVPLRGSFYLGINTGTGFTSSGPGRDVFGWVKISNTASGLSVVNSAMAYGERGIYIGSLTPVPEPTGAGLSLVGIGLLLAVKRNRRTGGRY